MAAINKFLLFYLGFWLECWSTSGEARQENEIALRDRDCI
jgi:hypothetical protein